ncbi:hypothetical protein ACEPAH_1045 [Sanghuangporus vaninii]
MTIKHTAQSEPLPPTYDGYYEIERRYPQHNASLPFPEGRNGRFIYVSNQHCYPAVGIGWNNVFQALILNTHMAYLSNRAWVFEPYTWDRHPSSYSTYKGRVIPSRIPLSALIDGPISGGPFPPEHPNPRAVSVEFFDQVCPENKRSRVSIKEMNEGLEGRPPIEIMEKYASKLLGMAELCVELYGSLEHPFDWMQFGDSGIETVVSTLLESPILRDFRWSPLVLSAVRTNAPNFAPHLSADPPPDVVQDLMAIHIRRGDYVVHCQHLANWSASFMGWAQAPGIPDVFVPPPGGGADWNTPENTAEYMRHCFPEIAEIVPRVAEAKHEWETRVGRPHNEPRLKRLYILTNGKTEWVAQLKDRLMDTGDWDIVFSSRDMALSHEQKYVGQAIDMAIAERAAVFLGNGFSSLTSNTVLLRRVGNLPIASNRFW